jgi:hypothetical protein
MPNDRSRFSATNSAGSTPCDHCRRRPDYRNPQRRTTSITPPVPTPCSVTAARLSYPRREVTFLIQRDAGSEAEAQFLDSLVRRELLVEDLSIADYQRMAELVRQYADFPLGSADASVIAVAERLCATKIATIDPSSAVENWARYTVLGTNPR